MTSAYKTLQLMTPFGNESEVLCVDFMFPGSHETAIGIVSRNPAGGWLARSAEGVNHGDRYNTRWDAAKQLALGLGKGEYVR